MRHALSDKTSFEKWFHIFWLAGPFILLIERSPADAWLSLIALAFVVRAFIKKDFCGLCFLGENVFCIFSRVFHILCIFSASCYTFGETISWFRFPLFAMATVFWLGTDKRLLYAMLVSTAVGVLIMMGILTAEMLVEGKRGVCPGHMAIWCPGIIWLRLVYLLL